MITGGDASPILLSDDGYAIQRSLRFRSSASASLRRVPTVVGNAQKFTLNTWKKLGSAGGYLAAANLDTLYALFSEIELSTAGNINLRSGTLGVGYTWSLSSVQLFRDPAAWYHIVIAYDTTQATDINRCKVWVNNQLLTFTGTYPAQNYSTAFNTTAPQYLFTADGYAAEVNFIDGQALTPSSFGQTDPVTGVWQPKKYTGTYGTNGFYLPFSDNTSATTLAYDKSGNGNNWTPNNISTTAGATYDSMTDVPTLTSATAANFNVINSDIRPYPGAEAISNGNLTLTCGSATVGGSAWTTIPFSSGKYYFEGVMTGDPGGVYRAAFGVCSNLAQAGLGTYTGAFSDGAGYIYKNDGNKAQNNTSPTAYGSSWTSNDVIGVAMDADNGTITFYKNGVSQGVAFTGMTYSGGYLFGGYGINGMVLNFNFGQRPFSYTPPTGFNALNTFNLPVGTITTSGTFTGNGSADGPMVYLNGVPTAMTVNGNAVTFGTHADKLANGFKVRTTSTSYNNPGASNSYSITTSGAKFKNANAQGNP